MRKWGKKGFAVWEVVALVAVLALAGVAGWYVYKSKHKTDAAKSSSASSKASPKSIAVGEPHSSGGDTKEKSGGSTDGWVLYTNVPGRFSFRHPASWVFAANPETCTPTLVLFASANSYVGKCASEDFGQMSAGSFEGDGRVDQNLSAGDFDGLATTAVTVDGVTGQRQTGVAKAVSDPEGMGMNPYAEGAIVVKYVFFTGGRTYTATYVQAPGEPDVLAQFDLLAQNTFDFL
jgi:hypothetical protein